MANSADPDSSKVTVILKKGLEVPLETNTPDIDDLVKKIVLNRTSIVPSEILVTCSDEKFDKKSFQEIIQNLVEGLLNDIVIEESDISSAKAWIDARYASSVPEPPSLQSGAERKD